MNSKSKVAMSIIIAILIMAIIGLAVGLVIVASQVNVNNSMKVTYKATNVQCSIEASGLSYDKKYGETETGKTIMIKDGDDYTLDNKTLNISATDTNSSIGSVDFKEVELTAAGRAVYKFTIKNTATYDASTTNTFKIEATVSNTEEGEDKSNIKVSVASTEADAVSALNGTPVRTYTNNSVPTVDTSAGATNEGVTFYVVLAVNDTSVAGNLTANLVIQITRNETA